MSIERLQEIYQKQNEEPEDKEPSNDNPEEADLKMKGLTFSYDPLNPVPTLEQIDLIIPRGKQTAIVGMSGSGKTTLVKLLLGFYPPGKGELDLGNTSLQNYNIRCWRKSCGVVMQDGFLFSDTIARNIAPATEIINREKLLHAVQVANIKEFIEELPLSYNTKIGQEGHGLSQGQKQRILIARAIYKDPEFIFFDEATNGFDLPLRKKIIEEIVDLQRKLAFTLVFITHDMELAVVIADVILVMKNSALIEQVEFSGDISVFSSDYSKPLYYASGFTDI